MLNWLRRSKRVSATGAAPSDPDALMREAFPLHEAGRVDEAAALYRRILGVAPGYADAHYLLGRIAQDRADLETAARHVRDAIAANRGEAAFHHTLGEIHFATGRWEEAAACFHSAGQLDASNFTTWTNLGCCYEKLGHLAQASTYFDKALALAPDSPEALNNSAMALKDRGRIDEALVRYRRARDLFPQDADVFSNYLYSLNFSTGHSREDIWREHAAYDAVFGTGRHGRVTCAPAAPNPERVLRLGYFSPDLRAHPVQVFLEPVLRHHDRARFHLTGYQLYPWPDATSARLRALCDSWAECGRLPDAAIVDRIRADRIDILVDLAGHTGNNRLAVLGAKPAPVQVTWLGYPNTTGLAAVDYRLTDAQSDPENGADRYSSERLVRLPEGQWCYQTPDLPIAVTPLPARARGGVCFGSFNNASKVNDDVAALWGEALRQLPSSTLLVWGIADEQRRRIGQVLEGAGVAAERVEFTDRTPFDMQLKLYQRVDIQLDTYPYSGVTTTFNALWMGVPVLTLAGDRASSRSTLSILTALGLADWATTSRQDFIATAVAKAGDLDALGVLRATLRARLECSPFGDAERFTRKLEETFRAMWRKCCQDARQA